MSRSSWNHKSNPFGLHAIRWGAVLTALLGWQWVGSSSNTSNFFFSKPTTVALRIFDGFANGTLIADTAVTSMEVILGFTLGIALGAALGLVLWWNVTLGRALRPFVVVLASIPIFVPYAGMPDA